MNIIAGSIYVLVCGVGLAILGRFIGYGLIWWIILIILALGTFAVVNIPVTSP